MSEEAPLSYCVLLRGLDASPSAAELAEALAAVSGAPKFDLMAKARRCLGVVDSGLAQEKAQALVEELKKRGIEGLAVPVSLLEDAPAADPCGALRLGPEGLAGKSAAGEWGPAIPWTAVAAVCAAVFKRVERRTVKSEEGPDIKQRALSIGLGLATGIPIGFGGGKKVVEKTVETSDLVYYLDLLIDSPARRLRVDAQDFDFSCLGARMGLGAAGNFRRLLVELAEKAPKAWRNRGARTLLAGEPLARLGYESLDDLGAEGRWLWTLRRLG